MIKLSAGIHARLNTSITKEVHERSKEQRQSAVVEDRLVIMRVLLWFVILE